MPLIHSKSKKALQKNIETEMRANPSPEDHDRNLAISYSVKRRAKKASGGMVQSGSSDMNMADGGEVSAKNEKRPMPDNRYNDSKEVSKNSGNKPAKNDHWTDRPEAAQSLKGGTYALKHPKMVPQNAYSVRLRDEEDELQRSASPGPYGSQPPKHDDEADASARGHDVRDDARQHNNGKKPYNKAIEDQYSQDMADADMKRSNSYANGGPVMEPEDDSIEHQEREYERQLQMRGAPSSDEGASDARSRNEMGSNRQGPAVSDMEEPHNEYEDSAYAEGGIVEEEEMEHAASLAAAIMAKRKRYARGGAILSEDSMESDDNDQADLSRNAEEDANMEDKASFDALRKENYSESDGLEALDQPSDSNEDGDSREDDEENINDSDIVAAIRRKSKIKSAISR